MGEGEPPAGGVSAGAGVFRSSESVRGLGGVLTIEVLAGRDLAPFDISGTSDPYVIVEVDGAVVGRTATVPKNLAPEWGGERFDLRVVKTARKVVTFRLFDEDFGCTDDAMGVIVVDVTAQLTDDATLLGERKECWYAVTPAADDDEPQDDAVKVESGSNCKSRFLRSMAERAATLASNAQKRASKLAIDIRNETRMRLGASKCVEVTLGDLCVAIKFVPDGVVPSAVLYAERVEVSNSPIARSVGVALRSGRLDARAMVRGLDAICGNMGQSRLNSEQLNEVVTALREALEGPRRRPSLSLAGAPTNAEPTTVLMRQQTSKTLVRLSNTLSTCATSRLNKWRRWVRSFVAIDPRYAIASFFEIGDSHGPKGYLHRCGLLPTGPVSEHFAVFRPTSLDAVRKMMQGGATGKSLNVKGKSAKEGVLSGFVPFLQIYDESHKRLIGASPRHSRIRVYWKSKELRDAAVKKLKPTLDEMLEQSALAEDVLQTTAISEVENVELLLARMQLCCSDPRVLLLDEHGPLTYGVDIPERLFREAFILRADISREGPWKTGRASEPAFQDANFCATRSTITPTTVVYQFDEEEAMNPSGLVVAYDEEDRVLPVASDFDAFTIGSRGMKNSSTIPKDQHAVLEWSLARIAEVLAEGGCENWTSRWLRVLKEQGRKGFHPTVPRFGFGDTTSYHVIEKAVDATKITGAVRHGAECFNYYFPQELDDSYLIVWHGFEDGAAFKYFDTAGLRAFLLARVTDGYSFPLNPKWVLCDEGWFEILEALIARDGENDALKSWFPPGILRQIREIHERHPTGISNGTPCGATVLDPDLADLELKSFFTLQRAKLKMRIACSLISRGNRALKHSQARRAAEALTLEGVVLQE